MAEKDITERHLASYRDVFAAIVNACIALLTGDWSFRQVRPEDLQDAQTHTIYTADGKVREQERDVAKFWTVGGMVISLLGLENQTTVDPDMPLRVLAYEGGDYRRQLGQKGTARYPVLTFVLYFGTERRWPEHLRVLSGRMKGIPKALLSLLHDRRIHVIELAWLTDEEAALFTGDIRFVIEVLRCIRKGEPIVLTDQVIEHVDAVLKLLAAVTGERRLESLPIIERGEPMTVRNIFAEQWDMLRAEGRAEGITLGREQGISLGREQGITLGREQGITLGRKEGVLHTLVSLVNDGLLPVGAAASRAGMSEDDFRARMRETEARKG